MRRLSVILVVSMLVMSALAPVALAEPHPEDAYIPMPVDPPAGYDFEDWWIELDPAAGGKGYELPPTDDEVFGDPDPEIDNVTGKTVFSGLDIGFNFKFFQGPAEGSSMYWLAQCYQAPPGVWHGCWTGNPNPGAWHIALTDNGYEKVFVGVNGYLVFSAPVEELGILEINPFEFQDHASVPSPVQPNNLVETFLTDLILGDNTFIEVKSVAFNCTDLCTETKTTKCNGVDSGYASGPHNCTCPVNKPVTGYWVPCDTREILRPRGRLLYKTVGEEPNQKFVVEWSNARVFDTGGLATFQVQLWEGNNAILFLYKDFKPMAFFEDPPHEAAFVLHGSLVVGLEDFYGTTGVGQAYTGYKYMTFGFFNPLDEMSALAFAPEAYEGVRAFVP